MFRFMDAPDTAVYRTVILPGLLAALLLVTAAPAVSGQLPGSQSPGAAEPPRTIMRDGTLSFMIDAARGTVVVRDLLNDRIMATTSVCTRPRYGTLSSDDVRFAVTCAGATRPVMVNTASFLVNNARPPLQPAAPPKHPTATGRLEVIMLGLIHGAHRTSTRFGTAVLERLIREIDPDVVLTEIPPNRFDRALREFRATGEIQEPRVLRFPEYVDVLFPLTRSMQFEIVPTAGWSVPMNDRRTVVLREIADDPTRQAEWEEYQAATQRARELVAAAGNDDPYFLNSSRYDDIQTAAHEPYNRLFNDEIGLGGWENINEAHFGHVSRALDERRGSGQRILITYGAGHREWFMRALRKRTDIDLLDVAPFLDRITAP